MKIFKFLLLLVLGIYSDCVKADPTLFFGIQPTSVQVSYGATAQRITLQFYIVNNTPTAQVIHSYALVPNARSAYVRVLGYANTCRDVIPARGPHGVCTAYATISAIGAQTVGQRIPAFSMRFAMVYGPRKQAISTTFFPITFADGTLTTATRTIKFINKCTNQVWLGVSSGATNSIKVDPAHPADLASCVNNTDCYPGSQCILVHTVPSVLRHCFWLNPAPAGNVYLLPANTGTNTVTFNTYNNGIDAVWSGGVTARTDCGSGTCTTGDCGGGGGACPTGVGFSAPITASEFTFLGKNPVVYSNTPNGNTDKDTYDVTLINGAVTPISMAPTNGTWGGASAPYSCGTPGSATAQSPLGACTWNSFTPPSSDDYNWVTYTTTACGSCTGSEVCGQSFNPLAAPGSKIGKNCGILLGYWTADAICAKDPLHNVAPFTCPVPVQGALTFADLYGCSTGALSKSCYTIGAISTCCGCVNWSTIPGVNVPASPITGLCQAINPNWTNNAKDKLIWLKTACPTAYSYPYDDASSTFTCQVLNAQNINSTNYTVTFCPQL